MNIVEDLLLYNFKLKLRDTNTLDLIVFHCTELPTLTMAREFGERILYSESGTGNSGHYYIDRDGKIYRYVQDNREAHHVIGHNRNSIGIEIVNTGRYPHWYSAKSQIPTDPYTAAQIDSAKELLCDLRRLVPTIARIARHSDLDTTLISAEDDPAIPIRRKIDPGPLFPWEEVQELWSKLLA